VAQDPESTRFLLTIYETPLPDPSKGVSITRSKMVKPLPSMAYRGQGRLSLPEQRRALLQARADGFDNCVMFDALAMSPKPPPQPVHRKDGVSRRRSPTAHFSTNYRQRVVKLLTGAAISSSRRRSATPIWSRRRDLHGRQFRQGDAGQPHRRRALPLGPMFAKARALYWDFAHSR